MRRLLDFILRLFEGDSKKERQVGSQKAEVISSSGGMESRGGEYFQLMDKNREAKRDGDYKKALQYALEALTYFKEVDEREDIQVIWPLIEAFRYLSSVKEGKAILHKLKKEISSDPKVAESWVEDIETCIAEAELMDKIFEFLKENPGFPQRKLWEEFDTDGRKWAPNIKFAEQIGAIRREGEDNKLYFKGKPSLKESG